MKWPVRLVAAMGNRCRWHGPTFFSHDNFDFLNIDCNSELSDRLWDYSHLPQPLSPDFRVFLFASHICVHYFFFPCICQRLYWKVSETLEGGTLGEGEAIGIIPFKMALEWKPTSHSFLSAARAWVASLGHMCPTIIICLISPQSNRGN